MPLLKKMKINISNMGNTVAPEEISKLRTTLEKQQARVAAEIAAEQEVVGRINLVLSAKEKLQQLVIDTLTPEELNAVHGMYLFLHGHCFDIVRKIPSSTDKGQGEKFTAVLEKVEALSGMP